MNKLAVKILKACAVVVLEIITKEIICSLGDDKMKA